MAIAEVDAVSIDEAEIAGIGQVALPVRDLERAAAFYRDRLHLEMLFMAPSGLAFFNVGGTRLLLDQAIAVKESGAILYFSVHRIEAVFERFKADGVIFDSVPHIVGTMGDIEVWMAFFRDPDGNVLALSEERKGIA